ncbi:MAG: hypothetical protein ORN51_15200 [Akkermansiaceae bacterium]|nr:hypothetical protein [Akkermansiaceae bacterium]
MKSEPESLELIRRYIDGDASEADREALQEELRRDPTTRRLFARYVNIDATLGSGGIALRGPAHPAKPVRSTWFSWRPVTTAAAGIVFGIFCTSMVFAYAVPRMKLDKLRVVPLFVEGFEDVKLVAGRGFPSSAGGWSGQLSAVIPLEMGVNPKEGTHMARLEPSAGRKFCTAVRIVDLAEYPLPVGAASQTVEVTASFHRIPSDSAERNQIRLAAFSEAPEDVKPIWNSENMFDQVLQHAARTVTTKHGENGWQTLEATMEIPPGARSLVIYLGAAVPDDAAPKTVHFLDDVRAQFVIKEATL